MSVGRLGVILNQTPENLQSLVTISIGGVGSCQLNTEKFCLGGGRFGVEGGL
jgi:hypothetical protein